MSRWQDRSRVRLPAIFAGIMLALAILACQAASPGIYIGSVDARGADLRMPEVHGTTLTGDTVDLPKMLSGKVGVLVIGFSRESREPIAAWGRLLAGEYRGSATVVYYEMPMLAEVPRLLRGMVLRSMRKEVPERAQARFVPLTEDEARWKEVVGYDKGDDAYLVVVDRAGRVCGRVHGPVTDTAFAKIKSQVETAGTAPAAAKP